MERLLSLLSIATLMFISSCSPDVLTVDRIPLGYFWFEFINDTECDCCMNLEEDSFAPKTIQIKPGDTFIQKQSFGGSSANKHLLIEPYQLTIVFRGEQDFSFIPDEHFSWTALPHTEELINIPDEHNTTYRFYLSDILALNQTK